MTSAADLELPRSYESATHGHDPLSEERALTRVNDLLVLRADCGSWWSAIARSVDDLIDVMWEHRADGHGGLHRDLLEEHPRLAFQIRSLEKDHTELTEELAQLRALIGASIGRPGGVAEVLAAATEMVARIRGHQRRARTLVVEAYQRDLGSGE
ncbi:MAG: hypothetical protein M0Z98_04770 [Actinomycetales bacterium]|nr:hypothetical protein [Actinomycetales bacterium]